MHFSSWKSLGPVILYEQTFFGRTFFFFCGFWFLSCWIVLADSVARILLLILVGIRIGCAPMGSFNNMLLRSGLRRFFKRRAAWKGSKKALARKGFSRREVFRREGGGVHRRRLEGAQKAEACPFAEYDPLCVHPKKRVQKNSPGKMLAVSSRSFQEN